MSIKKLFDSTDKTREYVSEINEKDAFKSVESSRNLEQIKIKQDYYTPHIDYANPEKFAKFGSAYLYYKSAMTRILDYYPYDGSDAEINKFHNGCLDIEKYILKNLYPRTNGYVTLNKAGYGTTTPTIADGYGVPSAGYQEHITFHGGPGTGSAANKTLAQMSPNEYNDKFNTSNLYDENIYQTQGMPSDYGKGTRTSNLLANFDDGVTVEFWLKTGSIDPTTTGKQVVFDWWNNKATTDPKYGRIRVELTGNAQQPFVVTVDSGSTSTRSQASLGSATLHAGMGDWHHYALSFKRTQLSSSAIGVDLFVDGALSDRTNVGDVYDLKSPINAAPATPTTSYKYSSTGSLQGWWHLGEATNPVNDFSGKGRTAYEGEYFPTRTALTPSEYLQGASSTFDGADDHLDMYSDAEYWNKIIGNGVGGTSKMTFTAWIRKTGAGSTTGTGNEARIIDFNTSVSFYQNNDGAILFLIKNSDDNSSFFDCVWKTDVDSLVPTDTWVHVAVTYDATDINSDPMIYVNGVAKACSVIDGAKGKQYWSGTDFVSPPVAGGCIGNRTNSRDRGFEGQIANVGIWNSVLAEEEIKAVYYASTNGAGNGLLLPGSTAIGNLDPKGAIGRIGSLQTRAVGTTAGDGAGKLSGSIDEFRYWKTERTPSEIGQYWFDQVRGGTNSDISNTTLGVYYKFNEGIVGSTKYDRIVLDYAGRATNGFWEGYTSTSRNTASAIVEASASNSEYLDPIIHPEHPRVISLRKSLLKSGSFHDTNNNSSFLSLLPGWIVDDEEITTPSDLQNICHIAGAYFDKLYLQIAEVPKLKQLSYLSSAYEPFPFAEHLPQSLGLYSPQLFVDASVMETFLNRNENSKFENDLHDIKNLIYTNLYNNLTHIFKSKGTERAIRNVFRTFNIDDRLLRLNINTNNNEFLLKNNFQSTLVKESCLNLNNSNNIEGVVYQRVNTANPESAGYISGSAGAGGIGRAGPPAIAGLEDPYGATIEANIIFPHYERKASNFSRNYKTVSLFGMHSVDTGSAASLSGTNTTLVEDNRANFQVYAVKEDNKSKNVYFKLTSSYSPHPLPVLTSSLFLNAYDNEQWNISVRIKPSTYPMSDLVSGSSDYQYQIIFQGINMLDSVQQNSFTLTASISKDVGARFLNASKRMYVGAERTNITGALIANSDVLVSSARYWAKYLEDYSLLQHAIDVDNIGISGSQQHLSSLDPVSKNVDMKNSNALWLDWKFNNVTSSNATGNFYVQDFSSGSALLRNNYGWLGRLGGYQHSGYGYGFAASSTEVKADRHVNTYRLVGPEQSVGSDMISIMTSDDRLYMRGIESIPNYIYSIEKSLSNAISEEMLDFMAGVVDFHQLIGAPVNRYRHRYKEMEKLRQTFFQRVEKIATVEKYMEYYKWFDDALTSIISQLVPASSEFVDDVLNVVESHVLERNKYKSVFPTLNFVDPHPAGFMIGRYQLVYPWDTAHSPMPTSPRKTNVRCRFWKERALRSSPEITSGDATVDAQREIYKKVIFSSPRLSSSAPVFSTTDGTTYEGRTFARRAFTSLTDLSIPNLFTERSSSEIRGGTNFEPQKNLQFARDGLYPAGPISREGGTFVPENVLVAQTRDAVPDPENCDNYGVPHNYIKKQKKIFKVQHGRLWEEGLGYNNVKSTMAFPFNIVSSSVKTGYNKDVVNRVTGGIEITNLHNDAYGPLNEKPMQGPFTNYAVGGLQSRHVPLNKGSDTALTRPEAWKIALGTCASSGSISGAIGMVGADYPPPNYTPPAGKSAYPYEFFQKAVYYRDMTAKRPVNVRNIQTKTGSTILGNYERNWEVVQSFGAFNNPRKFIDQQPTLPEIAFKSPTNQTTQIRTLLDIRRGADSHFEFVPDYSTAYLDGQTNESVILTRFRAPGGIEVSTRGYQDFKASEYSVYNCLNNRYLMNKRPWQNMSGNMVSEAPGGTPSQMRSYDQIGEDHGMYFLASTHTARFGRWPYSGELPGASYEQKPNFHKVHRNNLQRVKVKSVDWVVPNLNTGIVNQRALQFGTGAYSTSQKAKLYHSESFTKDSVAITSKTWTIGTYMRMRTPSNGVYNTLLSLGDNGASLNHDIAIQFMVNNNEQLELWCKDNSGLQSKYRTVNALSFDQWYHVAVTIDGTSGSYIPTFYIDGDSGSMTIITSSGNPIQSVNNVGGGKSYIGGTNKGNATSHKPIKNFDLDEMAIYDDVLTAGEMQTWYAQGRIVNLTASFAPKTGSLVTWMRFGDSPGDPTTVSQISGTSAPHEGPWFYDQMGNNNYIIKASVNKNHLYFISASSTAGEPLAVAFISGSPEERITYRTGSIYDNLNISHQIPRSDRQYAWLSHSIIDAQEMRYAGYQQIFGDRREYHTCAAGLVPFYNFVSASDEKGTVALGGGFQPVSRINTVIVDSVNTTSNVLGFPDGGAADYINQTLNNVSTIPSASYLNLLLAHRGDYYGWTWRQTRRANSPILSTQARNNDLSVAATGSTGNISHYNLPPVSLRGRPAIINFNSIGVSPIYAIPGMPNNLTIKATNDNESIYFNNPELTRLVGLGRKYPLTPFIQLLDSVMTTTNTFDLRWILYRQNIFPSVRNEFLSRSTGRTDYENNFWRDSQAERLVYGQGPTPALGYSVTSSTMTFDGRELHIRPNSFGAQGLLDFSNWLNKSPVQSSWPLDAPADFLTRSGPPIIEYGWPNICIDPSLRSAGRLNRAGELQNTYFSYTTASAYCPTVTDGYRWWSRTLNMTIGALYARKQMLNSPESVVTPSGITISQTGSGHTKGTVIPMGVTDAMEPYAGEAVWEAGSQAGRIIQLSGGTAGATWEANPSKPWYNNYTEFNSELKLIAKGYSIVPEFRISEHVEDYLKYGINNPGKTNTFAVPGTAHNSTTQSFYRDFTNSEFMKGFLGVKSTTTLLAKQIRLVCSAAIKFNPYEGFYPAQRTLQLVSQFSRSYAQGMDVVIGQNGNNVAMSETIEDTLLAGGAYRPIMTSLYSPGILYNSIKAGIAVDYPVVFDGDRTQKYGFGNLSQADDIYQFTSGANTYKIWPKSNSSASWALLPQLNNTATQVEQYDYTDEYWDARLPFETMIHPEKYMNNMSFADLESHPFMALNVTNSFVAGGDESYARMASNFFGEVGHFFLKDRTFTRLESQQMVGDMTFPSGTVYGARVKLRRSMAGPRNYFKEYGYVVDPDKCQRPDNYGDARGIHYAYSPLGGRPYIADDPLSSSTIGKWVNASGAFYPLPQDPQWNPNYRETFTMFSRTTAFGPPVSGRPPGDGVALRAVTTSSINGFMDSFNGFNWAFTPPYYHGESWADLIFRPISGKKYALEDIIAETKTVYWRVDPGPLSGSGGGYRTLIYGGNSSNLPNAPAIYGGDCINKNAMQLSASLNLFGVERVLGASVDKYGNVGGYGPGTVAKKWVIQPKFETPMLNFTNRSASIHPISETAGTLQIPSGYGSGSVPRGMWHQFGHIPDDPKTGIFMEIGDIPGPWLRYHYDVLNNPTVYNNYNVSGSERFELYNSMRSLSEVAGFDKTAMSKRLGELADSREICEAVVAIPYITTEAQPTNADLDSLTRLRNKYFFSIPKPRVDAALPENANLPQGSDLNASGKSIRQLVEMMNKYVLPPELDWVNNKQLNPFAMLIFEFKYQLDRDDLSYIWQNLAPRDYKKVAMKSSAVSMNLMNNELLQESTLIRPSDKVRWMVFKVKQRSKGDYYNLIAEQAGRSTNVIPESQVGKDPQTNYPISYNWPYDYLSIVELIKMDVDILFKKK